MMSIGLKLKCSQSNQILTIRSHLNAYWYLTCFIELIIHLVKYLFLNNFPAHFSSQIQRLYNRL